LSMSCFLPRQPMNPQRKSYHHLPGAVPRLTDEQL